MWQSNEVEKWQILAVAVIALPTTVAMYNYVGQRQIINTS